MSRNSVLKEFNVNRLAVIQEDMCCRAFWRWATDESMSGGRKDRKSCVSSAYRWWFNERDEIRVLRGDVYIMNSRGQGQSLGGLHISRHMRSDSHLTFSDQISSLSKSCYYHIRELRCIRPYLDLKTASTIATSNVHSKLDYCNSLYYNLPKSQTNRLQVIQNSLARAVVKAQNSVTSPLFSNLYIGLKS